MEWSLPESERCYLRELAAKQMDYAALPIMEQRKAMWYALNDGPPGAARPPFVIETWTFDRDFLPAAAFHCTSETGRLIERPLLTAIRNHELIDDDKVVPDTFDIDWFVSIGDPGVTVNTRMARDAEGVETGFEIIHPFTDLERDLPRLKPAACSVNREKTFAWQAFLGGLLGDILPVHICGNNYYGNTCLTQQVVYLMGMEAFFLAMYDAPDAVHRLMSFLRDNCLQVMRWAETEGLLCLNNGNQNCSSSFNFTRQLPAAGFDGHAVRLRDFWGAANSQETVGVAPEMFHDFCQPYYRDVCEPFGLLYYGCCEPAHPFWADLSTLPHLKKISISRWCDEAYIGEALRGTGIVYSRKPDPNYLSLDRTLNEEAWAKHIRTTLEAARGVGVEFVMRDVYTLHGRIDNARRAVEIARAEIERCC